MGCVANKDGTPLRVVIRLTLDLRNAEQGVRLGGCMEDRSEFSRVFVSAEQYGQR